MAKRALVDDTRRDLIKMTKIALYWRERWERSNPDVGMGPDVHAMLTPLLRAAGVTLTDDELEEIVDDYRTAQRQRSS